MKPLILLLLFAITLEAQTLADAARKERQRQAQVQSKRVITTEDARSSTLPPPSPSGSSAAAELKPVAAPAPSAASSVGPAAKVPEVKSADPAAKYQQDVAALRAKLRGLQDQETALQLQISEFTNKFYAPVTDTASRADAQARMGEAQNRLTTVRGDLDAARKALAAMEAQGPATAGK